jgi:outer membrane lipoprotein carrier protein
VIIFTILKRINLQKIIFTTLLLSATLLNASIKELFSLESHFTQQIINDQNSKITYTGKMYATKNNNQALWIYNSPVEKKIYYKGGSVVIIEPELEQVIFAKLSKVPNIMNILSNAVEVSTNTYVTTFNKIEYTINFNGEKIENISYTDEMQNRVTINFNSQIVNKMIENSKFSYSIPEDYDILEQ